MARNKGEKADDKGFPKVTISKAVLKKSLRIFKYMGPHKWKFFAGLVFLALTSATALMFPEMMKDLFNASEISSLQINRIGLQLLLLFGAQAIFSFFRVYLFVSFTENMLAALRKETYAHLIRMPMNFYSNRRVGEINSRMNSDIIQIQDSFTTSLAEFLRQFIIIIGGITLLFYTSAKLALLMLATIPLIAVVAIFFGRYIRKLQRQVQDTVAEGNIIIEETLQGISSVKSFTNEVFESLRYGAKAMRSRDLALKSGKARGAFFSFIIFCVFGAIILLIWRAVQLQHTGEITQGELIQFLLYTIFVGASIGGIADQYAQILKAIGATERVMDILDETTEKLQPNPDGSFEKIKGEVLFDKVKFAYPSRPEITVLKEVSFNVKPGERIAIVGPSGAGKSTITALLQRFYDPLEGSILLDGKPSVAYNLFDLRNNMAIVPQDVLLFGGTIKENIAYGNLNATMEEIMEAAKKANAHNFIEGFPEKYETIVGDRGIKLSGGQRQRIAIARAVLKNPSILILDEATSSLDSESERLVQEALDKLMVGRTSFIIAHRLSTIRKADNILVLDKGIIIESGTHEQLIGNQEGLYYQLSKLQFNPPAAADFN